MIDLAQMVEDAMFTRLKYKDICLMIDGGTLIRRKLLHIMIGNADVGVFFFRSIKVDTLNTDNIINHLIAALDYLQDDPRGPIYPIAIISDNARAFLNAIWAFTPSPLEEEDFELNTDEYFEVMNLTQICSVS